jgi:Mrp family chromosome partitioning ATPase
VKILAEIRPHSEGGSEVGSLRRSDLVAFNGLLESLGGRGAILVTGSEGAASAAAIGLATAAVAGGTRAALLECDLVMPTIARDLGIAERPGLRDYVLGDAEASDLVQSLVLAGPASAGAREPLVCVVAGEPAPDDAVLLASERFRLAVKGLRASYELLVVAGPPLERGFDRVQEVAELVDATVACAPRSELRSDYSRRLKRSLRKLPSGFRGYVAIE